MKNFIAKGVRTVGWPPRDDANCNTPAWPTAVRDESIGSSIGTRPSPMTNEYLTHPYFEVRAVAAEYASDAYLPQLLNDPDETVRAYAVLT